MRNFITFGIPVSDDELPGPSDKKAVLMTLGIIAIIVAVIVGSILIFT